MKETVEKIVFSYDNGFQKFDSIFETNYQIFEGLQESLIDRKQEGQKLQIQLRESLAKNGSLRKKDFDRMMQGILSRQVEQEIEIRNLINSYLADQKEMIHFLKDNLTQIKDAITKGEVVQVKESRVLIGQILPQQDKRKEVVTAQLKEFQKEQQEMTEKLLQLLSKGRELRIKDLKLMLSEFATQHRERLAQREERKKEVIGRKEKVQQMLSEFKQKRVETSQRT